MSEVKGAILLFVTVLVFVMLVAAVAGGVGYGRGYATGWIEGQEGKGIHFSLDLGRAPIQTTENSVFVREVKSGAFTSVSETPGEMGLRAGEEFTVAGRYVSYMAGGRWTVEGVELARVSDGSHHILGITNLWRLPFSDGPVCDRLKLVMMDTGLPPNLEDIVFVQM